MFHSLKIRGIADGVDAASVGGRGGRGADDIAKVGAEMSIKLIPGLLRGRPGRSLAASQPPDDIALTGF
jgi:hypothetical protein